MKKTKILLVSMIIVSMILIGCSGGSEGEASDMVKQAVNIGEYPVVDEPMVLDVFAFGEPGSGEWNDFPVFQELSEDANIKLNIRTVSGEGATEQLNITLASNKDLPDLFFSGINAQLISKYSSQGLFIPLEDLIAEYAPNLTAIFTEYPEFKRAMTSPDGHIYSIGSMDVLSSETTTNFFWLNKTWLDRLGLEVPTTTEELKAVLEAFKTQDPNGNGEDDEIPFTFMPRIGPNIWNGDTGFSGPFGVVDDVTNLMLKDGEFVFMPAEEGYKEYILWLNDLYTNGLLDQELFTQDFNQYASKWSSDNCGGYLADNRVKTGVNEYISITPLIGPDGGQLWATADYSVDRNRATLAYSNPNPEATIALIDKFFEPALSLKLKHGESLVMEDDGRWRKKTLERNQRSNAPGAYVPSYVSFDLAAQEISGSDAIEKEERKEQYGPYLVKPIPLLSLTEDELRLISTARTDTQSYYEEMKAKWVTGQGDINEDWDEYVEQLNKMGLQDYVEVYNVALDRFNNN